MYTLTEEQEAVQALRIILRQNGILHQNITTLTDVYKLTHHSQYPEGTEYVESYFEARAGSRYPFTTVVGQQRLMKMLERLIVLPEDVEELVKITSSMIGTDVSNRKMWTIIATELGGKLPVEIKAVPEGTSVPNSNVLMTVINTDPRCAALTNHLETILCQLWYTCNVATLSRMTKMMMTKYLKRTSEVLDEHIPFMLHDFGFRGATGIESAAIGGAAHLINFYGTDTVPALEVLKEFYDIEGEILGLSIPATEHSVMTALGREGEMEQVQRFLDVNPTGAISCVLDSYDYEGAVRMICTRFKNQILTRDGKFVLRPDSGNPVEVVLKTLSILEQFYEIKVNSKGFKTLPPQIGVIWGDGVDYDGIQDILEAITQRGWSSDVLVFGMGGGLLQRHNRDTQRFAFKASAICINGEWHDVFKDPKNGQKRSKKGRLALYRLGAEYSTRLAGEPGNQLQTIFKNGKVINTYTLAEVRENAKL